LKALYDSVCQRHVSFRLYFPDYDKNYCPQRKFFWAIYLTLHKEEAEQVIEDDIV